MRFCDLLQKYSNDEILKALHQYYDNINDSSYLSALEELRKITPSKELQKIKIVVEIEEECGQKCLFCDGIGPNKFGKPTRFGLDFSSWDSWLAKCIDENCLNTLEELTILAGIMWEITYYGFSKSSICEEKTVLLENINEINKKNMAYQMDEHNIVIKAIEDIRHEMTVLYKISLKNKFKKKHFDLRPVFSYRTGELFSVLNKALEGNLNALELINDCFYHCTLSTFYYIHLADLITIIKRHKESGEWCVNLD